MLMLARAADRLASRLVWLPLVVLALAIAQIYAWATDRKPPFKVVSVDPAIGSPGKPVLLVVHVWRDARRRCRANFTRHLYDHDGYRHDLEGLQRASPEMIADLERRTPGLMLLAVNVPDSIEPGRVELVTDLAYECNPLHAIWPIEVESRVAFEVVR